MNSPMHCLFGQMVGGLMSFAWLVGTPFCITVDFDTLIDGTVTLRDRDTTEQQRVSIPQLIQATYASLKLLHA